MPRHQLLFMLIVVGIFKLSSAMTHNKGHCDPESLVQVNELGKVCGKKHLPTQAKRHYYSYIGIPYAEEPTNHLRFKDPKELLGWEGLMNNDGILDTKEQTPPCLQFDETKLPEDIESAAFGDENCLTINVFTPKPNNHTAKLPVIAYIHFGAFYLGDIMVAHPEILLNKDIVLVPIQYRLGVLGFLTTEDNEMPGNLGLKDQAMALLWIKKNIKAFGGDPDNVTIMGVSAGSAAISLHMLSPKSAGLFQKAIMMGGSALCPWGMAGALDQLSLAKRVAAEVNCPTDKGSKAMHECFKMANATKMALYAAQTYELDFRPGLFGPHVDGEFLPERPEVLLKNGRFNKVPVLIGTARDEGAIYTIVTRWDTEEGIAKYLEDFNASLPVLLNLKYKGDDEIELAHRIFRHYFGDRQPTLEDHQKLTEMFSAGMFQVYTDVTALLLSHHSAPQSVYSYSLSYRGTHSFVEYFAFYKDQIKPEQRALAKKYVCHQDELFYLFGPAVFDLENTDDKVDIEMQNLISTMWINFASNGNPTPDESLGFQWLPSTVEKFRLLDINPQPAMREDFRQKEREFWLSLPTKQNRLLADVDYLTMRVSEVTKEEQHKGPLSAPEENINGASVANGNVKDEL